MTELPVAGGQGRAGSKQVARAPDYAGAYSGSGQRSRAHVYWCSVVGIFGVNSHALQSILYHAPSAHFHTAHYAPGMCVVGCFSLQHLPSSDPDGGGWLTSLVSALRWSELQVLVRALPGWAEVEADAVAFVVAAEDRLMLALEAPEGTQAQPLTLGALQARRCVCTLALTSMLARAPSSIGCSLQSGDSLPDSIRSKHANCSSHAA